MRSVITFFLLIVVHGVSRLLFRHHVRFVGQVPEDQWDHIRIVAVLNHTSLYEPLLAGYAPYSLLWQFARHGVLPVAEKTMKRRIGMFFRFLVRHVVVVTRQRDNTWQEVLNKVDRKAVTIILPEGRMKRRTGLDSKGRPMTVRAGIADILMAVPEGRMLVVYSGGLHHIQAPGEHVARPFRQIEADMEFIDVPSYREELEAEQGIEHFRSQVIKDLTRRRDIHCPAATARLRPSRRNTPVGSSD